VSKKVHVKIQAEAFCGAMGEISEQTVEIAENITYENLLDILGINEGTVIVLNEGNAVPLDGIISSDELTIMRVVSGG
jgi:sulfur carrier protein